MSKTDRTHIRHNLSFDMQDDQQRIAHEYLLKLDRGQSKKIAELICNMLSQNGIKNVATLSAEKAEKLSTLFFKLDDEKQKEAYEYLSILGERQFEKIADLVAELLSRNGVNDISNLTADEAYALEIMPWQKCWKQQWTVLCKESWHKIRVRGKEKIGRRVRNILVNLLNRRLKRRNLRKQ